MEDRLNPIPPEDADESTLGGYAAIHGRAAAFEGSDGRAYTTAIEADPNEDGDGWVGYLVFLQWAPEGSAIMGHLDSGDLVTGRTREEAQAAVEALSLREVKRLLEASIERKREWEAMDPTPESDDADRLDDGDGE